MVLGQLPIHVQKQELQVVPNTIHKIESKCVCKHKHNTIKLLEANTENYFDLELNIS